MNKISLSGPYSQNGKSVSLEISMGIITGLSFRHLAGLCRPVAIFAVMLQYPVMLRHIDLKWSREVEISVLSEKV